MIFNKQKFLICLLLSTGCSFQSTQYSFFQEMLNGTSDFSKNLWQINYRDYESLVYAIRVPDGIFFSNTQGDLVFFNGWTVTLVKGMGANTLDYPLARISNNETILWNRNYPNAKDCEPWRSENEVDLKYFIQKCSEPREYNNKIVIEKSGMISHISQVIDYRDSRIKITKLR